MAHSFALLSLALISLVSATGSTDKRGLVFVTSKDHPKDNKIWVQPGSEIKWYYNYVDVPSTIYSGLSQEEFEFVPMMWGVSANPDDTSFYDSVKSQIKGGRNITHVLGFNEPNAKAEWGGSDVSPDVAAQAWVANFEPLGEMGVKLGLPACMGSYDSLPWLKNFLGNCSRIVSKGGAKKNCTWDFLPVHWYDNFEGLASHIGERRATWPGAEIWITEYAYAHQDIAPTEEFSRQTLDYFDKVPYIGGYTYFGSFRSDVSNVGPNAAFLTNKGELTPIGAEYLGLNTTGDANDNAASGLTSPGQLAMAIVVITTVLKGLY